MQNGQEIDMTECDRRVKQNITACETIEGKPLSENDQTWIYVHVYRMMLKEKEARCQK
jgi:hypothetical protein